VNYWKKILILIFILILIPIRFPILIIFTGSEVGTKNKITLIITCADMSGGRKWEDFRWEDGWPVERTATVDETATRDEIRDKKGEDEKPPRDVTADGDDMQTEPADSTPYNTQGMGQVNSCSRNHHEEETERSNISGTTEHWLDGSDLSESGEDDTYATDKVDLGSGYLQCRAAREAANVDLVTDISCNENATKSEQKTGDKIGSMDIAIDRDIEGCFKGSRIEKNGVLVNQFLSSSFDPSTHICITCNNEHSILGGGGGGPGLLCPG
jgi:hypothetical protein